MHGMGAGFGLLSCATRRPPARGLGSRGHWLTQQHACRAQQQWPRRPSAGQQPSKTANPFIQASQVFKHLLKEKPCQGRGRHGSVRSLAGASPWSQQLSVPHFSHRGFTPFISMLWSDNSTVRRLWCMKNVGDISDVCGCLGLGNQH